MTYSMIFIMTIPVCTPGGNDARSAWCELALFGGLGKIAAVPGVANMGPLLFG